MGSEHDDEAVSAKLVLRPLIGLMAGFSPNQVETFVVEELEKHRRLRENAVRIEASLENEIDRSELTSDKREYISAMIAVHAQQTVVSTLLDILGYIPGTANRKHH